MPNIAPLVDKLYKNNAAQREAGFTLYYLGKNVGALFGPICCGIVGKFFGYNYAFLLSSLAMVVGSVVFILGRKHLCFSETIKCKFETYLLIYLSILLLIPLVQEVLVYEISGYLLVISTIVILFFLSNMFLRSSRPNRRNILLIVIMLIFAMIFTMFLNQGGTTLNLFIERIINRHIFNFLIPTTFFYAIDPIFMLIIGPFLALIFTRMALRNREPSIVVKVTSALALLSIGFGVFVMAANQAQSLGQASALYIVLAYLLFPVAELLIIPQILSFITKAVAANFSARVVGLFMFSQALAGYLTNVVSKEGQIKFNLLTLASFKHAAAIYHHVFMLSMLGLSLSAILLLVISPLFKRAS